MKELDYWQGRAAVLAVEGNLEDASKALKQAEQCAQKLPQAGAYEYDRRCVSVIRRTLDAANLHRLSQSTRSSLPAKETAPIFT